MSWSITSQQLADAQTWVSRYLQSTPLTRCDALGENVYVKNEGAHPTGAFKIRGAFVSLCALGVSEVVAASAGNHGAALAFAGERLNVKVTVFVPVSTPLVKKRRMRDLGASMHEVAGGYDDAERAARSYADEQGLPFVSPYDDPWVAAGNGGSLMAEVYSACPEPGAVIVPVGGGGLAAGIIAAQRGRAATSVIGVQSEACPAMFESLRRGEAILDMAAEHTLAEGLEGGVSRSTFALLRDGLTELFLVSEAEIAEAMDFAHERLGLTVEGSGATTVSLALRRLRAEGPEWTQSLPGRPRGPVILVLTGRNTDRYGATPLD